MRRLINIFCGLICVAAVSAQTWNCGVHGNNVTASLVGGTLTIRGTGAMKDYESDDIALRINTPWWNITTNIKKIIIENGVTTIGDYSFFGCESLTDVSVPNSVTKIGNHALGRTGLNEIIIPNSVTTIGTWAFAYCLNLSTVIIGNSVTAIGDEAFMNCNNLTELTIGSSVKIVGDWAFAVGNSLSKIYNHADIPLTINANVFGNEDVNLSKISLHVPSNSVAAYKAHPVWGKFNVVAMNSAITLDEFKRRFREIDADGFFGSSQLNVHYAASNNSLDEFKRRFREIDADGFFGSSQLNVLYAASNNSLDEFKRRFGEIDADGFFGNSQLNAHYAASNNSLDEFKRRFREIEADGFLGNSQLNVYYAAASNKLLSVSERFDADAIPSAVNDYSPSSVLNKSLNAWVQKDADTAFLYFYNPPISKEQWLYAVGGGDGSGGGKSIANFEILGEQISDNGENATVTVKLFGLGGRASEKTEEMLLIKTKDGWKLIVN